MEGSASPDTAGPGHKGFREKAGPGSGAGLRGAWLGGGRGSYGAWLIEGGAPEGRGSEGAGPRTEPA